MQYSNGKLDIATAMFDSAITRALPYSTGHCMTGVHEGSA